MEKNKSSGRYDHEHTKSNDWPIEHQVKDVLGLPHTTHTEKVTDTETNRTGSGSSSDRDEAREKAWDDLKRQD